MIVLLDSLSKSEKLTQQLIEFLMGEQRWQCKGNNIVTISLLVVQNNTTIIFTWLNTIVFISLV